MTGDSMKTNGPNVGPENVTKTVPQSESARSDTESGPKPGSAVKDAPLQHSSPTSKILALQEHARPVLDAKDPLVLVVKALRDGGYGGDIRPALLTFLAVSTRLLAKRDGGMPAHLLLTGPPSAGKNYTLNAVLRLLPINAYHIIHAGSPRVLIYDKADLRHRVLIFGEADSLPSGEDNPAASAIRNLLQDHRLHYQVTVRDPKNGGFQVLEVDRPGPTVLVTTATRRLGEQLDSRLFTVEVPDDQGQIRAALRTQAKLEVKGPSQPPQAIVAHQELLQAHAPWDVAVPYVDDLAEAIGRSPAASRVLRDFARLIALVKAVAVLRQHYRKRDERGRVVAEVNDYATIYALLRESYRVSVTGAGRGVRDVVMAVSKLRKPDAISKVVNLTKVADYLGIHRTTARRSVNAALRYGWLANEDPRQRRFNLRLGEPLPEDCSLPSPAAIQCSNGAPLTGGPMANEHKRRMIMLKIGQALTWPPIASEGQTVIPEGRNAWETFVRTADVNTFNLAIAALGVEIKRRHAAKAEKAGSYQKE